MAKVDRAGGQGTCHPWTGGVDRDGYGKVSIGGRDLAAHRVALELALGRLLSDGEVARHVVCDNPPCCNGAHLAPGTHADNSHDSVARGRQARGSRNGRARLTAEQATEIKARCADAGATYEDIGRAFGVSGRAVSLIATGKRWRHLPDVVAAREVSP